MSKFVGPDTKQDDPLLVTAIRQYVIDTPRPFLFKLGYPMIETPQAKAARKILRNKKDGFSVECGGLDGERSSNTIVFERKLGWNGLLVPPGTCSYEARIESATVPTAA